MIKINLNKNVCGDLFFSINYNGVNYITYKLAKLLNLSMVELNDLLINKVVRHNKFYLVQSASSQLNIQYLTFKQNDVSNDIYINRFKNTFKQQLSKLK